MLKIAQGAEARIFEDKNRVIKNRFRKKYRIAELDNRLRSFRTRREAKVLRKLESINFPSPKVFDCDNAENIVIGKIEGKLLRDVIDNKNYEKLCKEIGEKIALLHNNSIIHGDLTTSNMILGKKHTRYSSTESVFFIDFGLSFFSEKTEDKATDLHLLKEALESKHYMLSIGALKAVLEAYKNNAENSNAILKRLDAIEKRGRYRAKRL